MSSLFWKGQRSNPLRMQVRLWPLSAHHPTQPWDLADGKTQQLQGPPRPHEHCIWGFSGPSLTLSVAQQSQSLHSGCRARSCVCEQEYSKYAPAARRLLLLIPQSGLLFPRRLHGLCSNVQIPFRFLLKCHLISEAFFLFTPRYKYQVPPTPVLSIPFLLPSISPQHLVSPPDIPYIFIHFLNGIVFSIISSFHGNCVTHDNSYILQQTLMEVLWWYSQRTPSFSIETTVLKRMGTNKS